MYKPTPNMYEVENRDVMESFRVVLFGNQRQSTFTPTKKSTEPGVTLSQNAVQDGCIDQGSRGVREPIAHQTYVIMVVLVSHRSTTTMNKFVNVQVDSQEPSVNMTSTSAWRTMEGVNTNALTPLAHSTVDVGQDSSCLAMGTLVRILMSAPRQVEDVRIDV